MGGEGLCFPRDLLRAQPSDSRLAKPKEHETAFYFEGSKRLDFFLYDHDLIC